MARSKRKKKTHQVVRAVGRVACPYDCGRDFAGNEDPADLVEHLRAEHTTALRLKPQPSLKGD